MNTQVQILPMIVDLNFNEFMLSTLHVISLNNIEVASHWPAPPLSLSLVSLSPSPPPPRIHRSSRAVVPNSGARGLCQKI